MKAYKNNPYIKNKLLEKLKKHYDADEITTQEKSKNNKGGFHWCAIESHNNFEYEKLYGIPINLPYLADSIFKGLPDLEAKDFVLNFHSNIQPGDNLSYVGWKLLKWIAYNFLIQNSACKLILDKLEMLIAKKLIQKEEINSVAFQAQQTWLNNFNGAYSVVGHSLYCIASAMKIFIFPPTVSPVTDISKEQYKRLRIATHQACAIEYVAQELKILENNIDMQFVKNNSFYIKTSSKLLQILKETQK